MCTNTRYLHMVMYSDNFKRPYTTGNSNSTAELLYFIQPSVPHIVWLHVDNLCRALNHE